MQGSGRNYSFLSSAYPIMEENFVGINHWTSATVSRKYFLYVITFHYNNFVEENIKHVIAKKNY